MLRLELRVRYEECSCAKEGSLILLTVNELSLTTMLWNSACQAHSIFFLVGVFYTLPFFFV